MLIDGNYFIEIQMSTENRTYKNKQAVKTPILIVTRKIVSN